MVVDRTLYDILGVEPNATQEKISQACRQKSREHHPDRGGDHEKMQKVNLARGILTDREKRKLYDQYGLNGMQSRIENESFPFPNFHNERTVKKGNDIKHVLKISLEELYMGSTKTIKIERDIVCKNCKGTGCHDGVSRQCGKCDGTGIEMLIHRMGPFIQQIQSQCSLCNGNGNIIDEKNRCKTCFGKRVCREEKLFDVNIVHGSQNGEIIKFIGEANQIPNGTSGTLYVILKQEPHSIFNRKNDNLIMKMEINLTESLCGFQRLIKLLDGHQILIDHPRGKTILPNSYHCLKGYGMPNRNTHSHGDLIIQFHVKFPDENFHLTENQSKQLESILPSKKQIQLNSNELSESVQMTKYDITEENFQNGHQDNTEEDDEDDDAHQQFQGIPCNTQ
ncbi:unnamed protein product [Adineta steineri]|uniref:DnaJ-like protein n=1 Tax=Adineta steineri TaxID=433720 RepID=A0A814FLS1_9BILA|nr:unnamed protein product [Adineta steineri]CAF0982296.1 unnamed protein product [Adineta steineri]CAF3500254.1 unnamed protein product [Adineta steineri]CAF3512514.1 unnamed protein product [Adineta steineri]